METISLQLQLGMRIRYIRQKRRLSQEDLALEANISKNYLSDVECGRRNPSLIILSNIAKGLHVDLATLFLGVGDKSN